MTAYTLFGQASVPGSAPSDTQGYTFGVEFSVSTAAQLTAIWWYSPSSATILPVTIALFAVSGTSLVHSETASWSGAAGSGWIRAAFSSPPSLTASANYKGCVLKTGTGNNWYIGTSSYWSTGAGSSGITSGILTAPNNAGADVGQDSYHQGGSSPVYPGSTFNSPNYWVDVEVSAGAVTGAAALSGTGTLAAGALAAFAASAALSGSGALTAAAAGSQAAAAALSGSGTLAAAGSVTPRAGTLATPAIPGYAQPGSFIPGQVTCTQPGAAALSGSGSLSVTGLVTQPASASLSGSGALSAASPVQFAATAALAGSGALTAPALVAWPGAAALSGSGMLSAATAVQFGAVLALSGSGALTAAGSVSGLASGSAALSGTGALAVAATVTSPSGAALSGTGSLAAGAAVAVAVSAVLAGTGTLTVSVQVIAPVTEPSVAWSVTPSAPRWTCAPEGGTALPVFQPVSALSLECINVLWVSDLDGTSVDPTGQTAGQPELPVQMAFPLSSGDRSAPAEPSMWYTASWLLGGTGKGYVSQALVGPGGVVTLTAGQAFDCWSKVSGSPESPVKFAGTIEVY